MNVRISANSIRVRLRQLEVKHFQQLGEICDITTFGTEPTDKLTFFLKAGSSENFEITFQSKYCNHLLPKIIGQLSH